LIKLLQKQQECNFYASQCSKVKLIAGIGKCGSLAADNRQIESNTKSTSFEISKMADFMTLLLALTS